MRKTKYKYLEAGSLKEIEEMKKSSISSLHVFETHYDFEDDPDWLPEIAEEAAEHDHSECDGWESTWPRFFAIFNMEEEQLGVFSVEREAEPVFAASKA
jgi:hypothetical protein